MLLCSILILAMCDHNKTVILARREGVDYVECLECKEVFEAEDLEPAAVEDEED